MAQTMLNNKPPESSKKEYDDFILKNDHPCLMAQTVFSMEQVDFHEYKNFGSRKTAVVMLRDLKKYIEKYDFESNDFLTFLAVFKGQKTYSEEEFEKLLWQQLQYLHEEDDSIWDDTVKPDSEDPDFSFSLGGKAFYIVGMHPNSSRKARQAPYPTLAFNLHWQFEKLRDMNIYLTLRNKIRERDINLQGDINPMLEDFGKRSEARQYSGRKVGDDWNCPFLHKKK